MKALDHGRVESKTYYEALCVGEDATYSEIRSQYRKALISLHPDKKHFIPSQSASLNADLAEEPKISTTRMGKENFEFIEVVSNNSDSFLGECQGLHSLSAGSESGDKDSEILDRFLRVQKAWEVLKDVKCREAYDYELQALRYGTEVVANEIELDEMSTEEDGERGAVEYFYPCRCGDYFVVVEAELVEMGFRASKCEGDGIQGKDPGAGMVDTSDYRSQDSREHKSSGNVERRYVLWFGVYFSTSLGPCLLI
ncbi:hypothetical protein SUGI_0805130 [Cryptomeria japonica]|uniref:uncharacterized protein LOC131031285 n=1 Tax=Cryptomeria japonica TaxID=3369 RepID=UPI002414CEE7|nr:uncharacterized protein LOC131031285 [Cryptomeria japonica]GLJ39422.1 hypothetical protein SUGI_0805130 [Cryptomeria japonica]